MQLQTTTKLALRQISFRLNQALSWHMLSQKKTSHEMSSSLHLHALCKVDTPYHDNDLIMTPIISSQSGW
jgi:hypothetical protein